jgi:hypothetical protein
MLLNNIQLIKLINRKRKFWKLVQLWKSDVLYKYYIYIYENWYVGKFDLAEHFSINKESWFHLTKVVFLRFKVVNGKLKNSAVSTIIKDALFFKSIIPTLIKINI